MTEDYLTELKSSGVICGGGEEERLYRVEFPRRGERVCGLNLEHPRVPHWLWVNEVMFTEFGVRIPFTPFQQRLLQRCFVASSQFHPNAWSAIRWFELVTEFLDLPQDPEVFLFLFTVFSPNADGKAKKGYMSAQPGKGRRIFGVYEESFHDFKGRYFKVFPVGDHPPFWLTLKRDAVKMAGRNKTLASLHRVMAANPQGYNRRSLERKWPDRAKGTKGSQQNLEGHCWTRCVRISEAMRTHPIHGRHVQKAVSAQMRTHSELLCYASVVISIYK
ncbi:hypothetical protein PIB30_022819 [Stylosanthes scabra]|uniref:Transposase n=1 Tax=Stylosanthes scabra TaxID=79078 RepID=A0ABU6UCL6_9FABA|nr:hypothetical protein [Stylosanthes scabra]